MKKPDIASNLIDYISAQIMTGRYPVGSKLPSLRSLARKFGISYTSAWNGIEFLEQQGKLCKSARHGIFVQSTGISGDGGNGRQLALITPYYSGITIPSAGMIYTALTTIEAQVRELGYSLLVMPLPNLKTMDPAVVEKLSRRCLGAIIMKEIDEWLSEWPLTIPTVGILMEEDYGGRLSLVGIDPYGAARQAVNFFLAGHIPEVHVLYYDYPCYRLRANLFELYFRQAGGMVTGHTVIKPEMQPNIEHFSADRGYFFASDNLLYSSIANYRRRYRRDPLDCRRMIAVDGKSLVMNWEFAFPTIAVDWREVGKLALAECLELIREPERGRRRIYLPGKFISPG